MSLAPELVRLGDLAEINPRLLQVPAADALVSFVPMAAVSAITARVEVDDERRFEEVRKGYTSFQRGDVLLAKITPCFENGKIAQANLRHALGFGSTEFHVIRPASDKLDARYLLHYLRQDRVRSAGERRMTGSAGQRRVPESFIADLPIPLPTVSEQRRIAAVLDKADALRQKRRDTLAKLESLPRAMFLDTFGEPSTNPRQWPRRPLGELLEEIESGWSPNCLDRPAQDCEWGVLKLGAVTSCEYDAKQNKALPAGIEPRPRLEIRVGDLLFTRKNTAELVAACVLVRESPPRLMMSDLIFRLHPRQDVGVEVSYLHQVLIFPTKRSDVQKLAGGSAGSMPNISKARLATVEIELPPVALQREFARRVAAAERLRTTHRTSLAALDALFVSLQYRAFRGELDPRPL